jgi:hypothetical protein
MIDFLRSFVIIFPMYIETVPNRNSPPAILLREAYREDGKVKKRTLLNLTDWPTELVEGFRTLLKGGKVIAPDREAMKIRRSLPHGHVAAALGTLRAIGLDRVLGSGARSRDSRSAREQALVIAMVVSRLIAPSSKLATAVGLSPATATSSLGEVLGLGEVDEDELYAALDWLIERQPAIETALAKKHLANGVLVLYDVSSSYVEGSCCSLAKRGYSRDGKKDKLQIVYGLLCSADGCPVAVEVFEGNTADPTTLTTQIAKIKERFGLDRVVLVGDRGMITQARLQEEVKPAGLDWITALRAPAIRDLLDSGAFQPDLFDDRDMASITAPDYPGERLVVCRNPQLAKRRAWKREQLLTATEDDLNKIGEAVRRARNPLRGQDKIGLKVGAVLNAHKMAKHFALTIEDDTFTFIRKTDAIAEEAALDGIYVVRTGLPADVLDDAGTVAAYKRLCGVERAFRSLKTVDLEIRPIFHYAAPRVKAHVLLCMLAYYVEFHMRAKLGSLLYDDTDKEVATAMRNSPVAKAQRSPSAKRKDTTGFNAEGLPVQSFQSLLADIATYCRIRATTALNDKYEFTVYSRPTPTQARAFELLGITPERTQ